MNKFIQNLTKGNAAIKEARANIIGEDALDAQTQILDNLKREKRELDRKLLELTDMYPDSELSLRVVKKDFNAKELFKDIQETKVDLLAKKVELTLAEETYKEWFGSEEKETNE